MKTNILIFILVILTIGVGFFLQVVPVYRKMKQAELAVAEKTATRDRLRAELHSLQQEVHDLEHERAAIEKVAREKFHLCKEDEQIYLYTE